MRLSTAPNVPQDIAKVIQSIQRLEAFHQLGRALVAKPKLLPSETEPQLRRRLSVEHGFSGTHPETARRAVRPVSPGGFSAADVRGLIRHGSGGVVNSVAIVTWVSIPPTNWDNCNPPRSPGCVWPNNSNEFRPGNPR